MIKTQTTTAVAGLESTFSGASADARGSDEQATAAMRATVIERLFQCFTCGPGAPIEEMVW